MSKTGHVSLLILLLVICSQPFAVDELPEYRIGFLEAGEYPQFDALRGAYRAQINEMAEGKFDVQFPAVGFRTAVWNRDSCKVYAQQLASSNKIDLIVALGPWVVFDLLEAGCTKPIVAAHQYDPVGAGLLNNDGKPIAPNLALSFDPTRTERELKYVRQLFPGKKIGLLHFPSGNGEDSTVTRITRIVDSLGGQVVSAEGFDNVGTYAFFKAYQELRGKADVIYVTPTYGLTTMKTAPFFEMVARDRVPVISAEGRFHVTRGAMIGLGSDNLVAEGYYNARQTFQIMEGARPVDLPVAYQQLPVMSINQLTVAQVGTHLPRALLKLADLFGEPPTDNATHLDLPTALAHGLAANPDVGSMNAKLKVIQAEASSEKAALYPRVDLQGKLGWQGANAVDNSYGEAKKSFRSIGLYYSQPIVDYERWARMKVGETAVAGSKFDQARVVQVVEEGILFAYYELARLQDVAAQVTEQRRRVDLYAELAQAREQAGETDGAERVRWQIERLKLSQVLVDLEKERRIATKTLSLLSGHGWSERIVINQSVVGKSELVAEYGLARPYVGTDADVDRTIKRLTEIALENNLALKQTRTKWNEAGLREKSVRAGYWPKIIFDAGLTWRDSLEQMSDGFEESSPFWSAGLRFNWGLINIFSKKSAREMSQASFDQAGFEMDSRLLEVSRAISRLSEDWIASFDKLPLVEEQARQSTAYLNSLTEKYLKGQVLFMEINDGLNTWVEGGLADINERFAYYKRSARLLHALGGSIANSGYSPGEQIIDLLSR